MEVGNHYNSNLRHISEPWQHFSGGKLKNFQDCQSVSGVVNRYVYSLTLSRRRNRVTHLVDCSKLVVLQ